MDKPMSDLEEVLRALYESETFKAPPTRLGKYAISSPQEQDRLDRLKDYGRPIVLRLAPVVMAHPWGPTGRARLHAHGNCRRNLEVAAVLDFFHFQQFDWK
jgi:hypothetical protein